MHIQQPHGGNILLKDTVEIERSNMARHSVTFEYSCIARIKQFRNAKNNSNDTMTKEIDLKL